MYVRFVKLIVLWMLAIASPIAIAASFDCTKARHPAEYLVCGSAQASSLDEHLAATYAIALKQSADIATLRAEQRGWLRDVRNACTDEACMIAAYRARITALMPTAPSGGLVVRTEPRVPDAPPPITTNSSQTHSVSTPAGKLLSESPSSQSKTLWIMLILAALGVVGILFWITTVITAILTLLGAAVIVVVIVGIALA